jgi:hypothetical protein
MPVASHGRPRLRIGQGHAHGHQSARAVRIESGFNMVVRRLTVGQVHPLHMNNPVVRLKLQKFDGQIESTPFTVRPLVTDLAAGPRLIDADGHGPTFRTEQPFLDSLCQEQIWRRCSIRLFGL